MHITVQTPINTIRHRKSCKVTLRDVNKVNHEIHELIMILMILAQFTHSVKWPSTFKDISLS